MVIVSSPWVIPMAMNMAEINGGDPNHLLTGMILQAEGIQLLSSSPYSKSWFRGRYKSKVCGDL